MKSLFTIVFTIGFIINTYGQEKTFLSPIRINNRSTQLPTQPPQHLAKPTATDARIKAMIYKSYDGAVFVYEDSSYCSYTGMRGGKIDDQDYLLSLGFLPYYFQFVLKYDQSLGYEYDIATLNWEENSKDVQSFDANDNISENIQQGYDIATMAWENNYKSLYQYDMNGNQTDEIYQKWNAVTNAWDNYRNYISQYNSNNQPTQYVTRIWIPATTSWKNLSRTIFNYNASGQLTSIVYQDWDAISNAWENDDRTLYTYTGNNATEIKNESWDNVSSTWENNGKMMISFNTNHLITEVVAQNWNTTTMVYENSNRIFFKWDANNNIDSAIVQIWDNVASQYENQMLQIYGHNSFDYINSLKSAEWDNGLNMWVYTTSSFEQIIRYETYSTTATNEVMNQGGKATIYPVPATSNLNIQLDWDEAQPFSVRITDMMGRTWSEWKVGKSQTYAESTNISMLPNGNYWIIIEGDKGKITQQISVLH